MNHTFTSHLALSASLQPYAGLVSHEICEFPFAPKPLALDLVRDPLPRDANGQVRAPDGPGLGVEVRHETIARYLVDAEIRVGGRLLYRTPSLGA